MFENFLFKINHYGPLLESIKNKIGGMGLRSGYSEKKILKQCPDQNLTKGKIVLELLKYAKSAIRLKKKFQPIRGLH